MSRAWKMAIAGLVLVLGIGACSTAVFQHSLKSLKPNNYPGLIHVIDSERCGEVKIGRINKGYSVITYDCYIVDGPINDVILFYLFEGYDLQGRLLRHQEDDYPIRSHLTHMVNLYTHDDAPMQVRVTTIYTAQTPRLNDDIPLTSSRTIIPSAR